RARCGFSASRSVAGIGGWGGGGRPGAGQGRRGAGRARRRRRSRFRWGAHDSVISKKLTCLVSFFGVGRRGRVDEGDVGWRRSSWAGMPTIRFSARAWPRRWRWRRVRCGFSASRSVADTGGWEGGGHGGLSAFGLETCPRSWARVGDGGVYLCGDRKSVV